MKSYTEFVNNGYRADGGADVVMKHTNIQDGNAKMPHEETDLERLARTGLSSNELTDRQASLVQKTPNRIALADIEAAVDSVQYMYPDNIPAMTICTIRLKNGYGLVGKSATADPENFNKELGMKFAREDAIRQAWALFAFALRERLTRNPEPHSG